MFSEVVCGEIPRTDTVSLSLSFCLTLYIFLMLIPLGVIALGLRMVHAIPATAPSSPIAESSQGAHAVRDKQNYPPISVDVTYANYEGHKLPSGINQWLGMRYAAPPLGKLRFKGPQDPLKSDQKTDPAHEVCFATTLPR